MRKRKGKRGLAFMLALLISIHPAAVKAPWGSMVSYADTWNGRIYGTTVNVRSGAGTGYQAVDKLTNGTSVSVVGQQNGSDGKVWYQIQYGAGKTGYVRSDYIKQQASYGGDADFEAYLSSQGFPESYKDSLRQLHAEYPNWQFIAQHTGLDWADAVKNESVIGRNLVYLSSPSSWKSIADGAYNWKTSTWPGFDSSSWVAASEEIISYYMDPRNFLDDKYIFQFLLHSYDSGVHTAEGLKTMVKGTFLEGSASVSGGSGTGPGSSPGAGPGSESNDSDISTGGPGSESNGSDVSTGGPGSESNGSDVSTGGPGSGGSGVTTVPPGSGNSASSGGSGQVSMTPPGSADSGNVNSNNAGTSRPGGNASTSAPSGNSSNNNVSLQAPGASLQARQTRILMNPLAPGNTAGPGGSGSSSGSSSSGIGPGGSMGPGGAASGSGGSGSAPTADYVTIIMDAAQKSGVNPYVLAAMIIQEQGKNGSGGSISGTEPGYQGYYNFFNIEAYQSGSMTAVQRGLWYASQSGSYERPWNSVDRSILGGAKYYGANYVQVGQDTFYLKKFNVQGSNLYKHQYMTNIQGAASEGAELSEAYSEEMKQTPLQFKIPVYYNMPAAACAKPTLDGSPNNKLSGLGVDGFRLTPTFDMDTTSYDLIVDLSVGYVDVAATAYSSVASISGTGRIQIQSGINEIVISVKAQNGSVREYVIHVVRQNNGPTHNSSLGNGLSGGSSGGPGGSTGPGSNSGSNGSGIGPGSTTGPGSSSLGSSIPEGSTTGPGGSGNTGGGSIDIVTDGEGPGGASSGNSGSGNGPGGSHVTIVQ